MDWQKYTSSDVLECKYSSENSYQILFCMLQKKNDWQVKMARGIQLS
jgi:hypothetical protein